MIMNNYDKTLDEVAREMSQNRYKQLEQMKLTVQAIESKLLKDLGWVEDESGMWSDKDGNHWLYPEEALYREFGGV